MEDSLDIDSHDTSIGFVSTYAPTVCGIASYTASLVNAVASDRDSRFGLGVVDLTDRSSDSITPDVVFHHRTGDRASLRKAARTLNSFDAVSIQHEFGIFGGTDGDEVIDLVSKLTVPTVVTFHTVLEYPSENQRLIVDRLAEQVDRMVVMSQTASQRLILRYGVDPKRVEVIPHGADALFAGPSLVTGDRPLALTWGLIGPGKGLESAIEAFGELVDLDPLPRYLIAGATHPHVRAAAGESYRQSLISLVHNLGLEDLIEFDNQYLDRKSLARLVRSADLVVLPYESVEQVTSGVLVEAIAASKPVIATQFSHAVELLSGGAGITVPHGDPGAMSAALRRLLTDARLTAQMAHEAQTLANGWYWPTIGQRFGSMMGRVAEAGRFGAPRIAREVHRVAG
ncbi:MAG: glycosyltransferase [Acidimicrobiia bacterium]|nr:glycosyltransferase [Acidimicrobiia bacterium]